MNHSQRAYAILALFTLGWSESISAAGIPKAKTPAISASSTNSTGDGKNKELQAKVDKIIRSGISSVDTVGLLIELEYSIAHQPGQESWLEAAGILHFNAGQFDRARRSLLKLRKPSSGADRLLALSLFEMKEYRKSLVYFHRMQNTRSSREDWKKFCEALAISGSRSDALREWEAYRDRYASTDAAGQAAGLEFMAECYRRPLQKEKLIPILEALLKTHKGQPEESQYLLELSGQYEESHIKAVDLRIQYLKLHPNDSAAARGLAMMHEARGEIKKALPILLEIAPRFTKDVKFNRHLAGLLSKTDKEKAILFYEVARTLSPKEFEISLAMARLQEELKHPDLALEAYQSVLEKNPTHPEAKARMTALVGQSRDAGPWLQSLVENEKKNPKDHVFQFQLAKLFLAAKDKEASYKYLQKALLNSRENPEYTELMPLTITTDAQILKNFSLLQKLAVKPGVAPELMVLLGRGYSLYHNQAKAAEAYGRVMSVKPALLEGHRQPILELFGSKDFSSACSLAEKFMRLKPDDADISRIYVASLVETNGQPMRIRAAIQALIALEPYDDKWYLRLAELDLVAKDTAAALKHGHEWVKMHPEDKRGLLFLEPLAAKAKNGEMYFTTMENLGRLEPGNQAQYELKTGLFLFESGKYAQAAEVLGKLATAFANDARYWNRLGMSQLKLGREEAKIALEKAHRLEPSNTEYARCFALTLSTDSELQANLAVLQVVRRASPDKEEKRKLAHALFLNGNFSASAQEWDWFLTNDPNIAIGDSTAGMAYLKVGQIAKAKPLLEKRLVANPRDVGLLATLAEMYGKEGDAKRRISTMEKLVQEDQSMGDYVLRLAKEKEKNGQAGEALALYSQWTFRHQEDIAALKAFHDLAEKQKDSTALIEALRHLTKIKEIDRAYRFQLAEVYFARSGETKELEGLVLANPDYQQGKRILIAEYHSKQAWDQLAKLESFLVSESATNSDLLEALADLYAHQKNLVAANQVYYSWLAVRRKQREVFDKVYAFAKESKGPNLIPILKLGCESFPDDLTLKADYGASMGNTRSALDAYQELLAKQPNNQEATEKATQIAKAIGDRTAVSKLAKRWSQMKPDSEEAWRSLMESLNPSTDKPRLAEAMEGLLRILPGNFDLTLQLAKLQEELGHFEKSIGLYRNALYLSPKDKSIRDRLITLMKEKGKKEELADVLTEIQNIDSSAQEAQFELAKLFLQKQDKIKAYAYLISALGQNPLNQTYQKLLPKVIHTSEQVRKHFPLLQEIASRPETARSDIGNLDLYFLLAQGYASQGKWEEAALNFATVYNLNPKKIMGDRDALLACFRGKNYALTSSLAEKFFETKQDFDKEIRQIQIICFEKTMKDPAVIRKALQLLLAVDKENAGGQLRLAELELRAKDTAAAINNIRNCLTTSPKELRAYKMLLPLISTTRVDQRVTYVVVLEKLAQLDSVNKAEHQIRLADFYFKRKNFKQTARLLSEVSESRPKDADIWYRLGQCRNQLQVGDQGISCFKLANELQPSNVIFAHTYAQALGTPEDFKANVKLYEFVEDRGPSPHELFGLAMAYFYNDNFKASAKAWDKVQDGKHLEGKFLPEAAITYIRTTQPAKALPLYLLRLEREANNIGLLDTLCALYTKTENSQGRLSMLESVVKVDATFKDYQLQLAKARVLSRDTLAAIEHYGQWTARNNQDAEALKAFHLLAQTKKDTASLENALRLLVAIRGLNPEYSYQLAELQFKYSGDPTELERLVKAHSDYHRGRMILAMEYYRRYDLPKMIPFEKQLSEASIKNPELTGALAELGAYQNKTEIANKAFRDFLIYRLQASKSSTGLANLRTAFDKAWIYGEANKSPYLIEILEIGNQAFPGEHPIQHALAANMGRDPRALGLFKLILEKDPNDLVALRSGSELSMTLGRQVEAIAWLESWANIEPGSTRAWKLLAEAYVKGKDLPKAADALDHQMLLTPTDAALAFSTAQAYLAAKNREKALEFFIRAAELKPKDPAYAFEVLDLLQGMTEAFLAQGQISRAVDLFGLLLDREPTNKKANLYLGMWLAENRDYLAAGKMLKTGIDQSPEPKPILAKAWKLLGDCQAGRGETKEALDAYKRSLILDPANQASALGRLEMTRALKLDAEIPTALAEIVRLDSTNQEAGLELANIFLKEGRFQPAAALLRRVTLARPADPDIWNQYGEALEGDKRNDAALEAWEKAYRLGDRTPYSLYGIARLNREAGSLVKAEKVLDDLVVLQPENDEASAWLAEIALGQERLEKAEEMFAQASQNAPDKIEYIQGLAEVYLHRKDAESVLEILGPVRGRLTPEGRLTLAEGLRLVGKPESAMPLYEEVYQKQPSARALTGLTQALLDRNKPAEAKRIIEASKLQTDPEVKLVLAKSFLALQERGKASEILKALVEKYPENPIYRLSLGELYYEQKNNPAALKEFKLALQKRADLAPAAYYTGLILVTTGHMSEGRGYFMALAQNVSKSERAMGMHGLATSADLENRPSEASDYLVQAAEVYPTQDVLAELSNVSLRLNRIKEAEEWAQKSLENDENFPAGIVAFAEVMMAQGHKEEARDFLKEALTRNPRSCEVHLEFAKVMVAMDNFPAMALSSNQALTLCPDEPLSYYYAGLGADRTKAKKQAEEYFRSYKKLGGNLSALPKGY